MNLFDIIMNEQMIVRMCVFVMLLLFYTAAS